MQGAGEDHDLLVRIDERTQNISAAIPGFVTRKEFQPVKSITYGLVGIITVAVVGALVSLVLK